MPARIFVNYRRSDSQHAALALAEALRWAFVDGEVFFDRSSLLGAQPWPERLTRAVRDARLVIPVIGDRWLKAVDEYGRRRIDHPDDWVRRAGRWLRATPAGRTACRSRAPSARNATAKR